MDNYRAFKKEVAMVEESWKMSEGFEGFWNFYVRSLYRKRLSYRVLTKFRIYKRQATLILEAIETIIEPENSIETINTIRKNPKPLYSLKIKCKFQIND